MKVYIGPYKSWIGPYQIANKLKHFGASEDRCHKIGEWLSNTWVNKLCQWIDSKRKRTVKVRIDRYDTWNLNDTLALIIFPMLKQLKATTHGSPHVDDEDVPENLRSTSAPPKENEWDVDGNHHQRWEYVLDEMIWAFEQLQPDCNWEEQFSSGTHDIRFEKVEQSKEVFYKMITGPNDTYKYDYDGAKAWSDRIANGTRLFGKYYSNLWD